MPSRPHSEIITLRPGQQIEPPPSIEGYTVIDAIPTYTDVDPQQHIYICLKCAKIIDERVFFEDSNICPTPRCGFNIELDDGGYEKARLKDYYTPTKPSSAVNRSIRYERHNPGFNIHNDYQELKFPYRFNKYYVDISMHNDTFKQCAACYSKNFVHNTACYRCTASLTLSREISTGEFLSATTPEERNILLKVCFSNEPELSYSRHINTNYCANSTDTEYRCNRCTICSKQLLYNPVISLADFKFASENLNIIDGKEPDDSEDYSADGAGAGASVVGTGGGSFYKKPIKKSPIKTKLLKKNSVRKSNRSVRPRRSSTKKSPIKKSPSKKSTSEKSPIKKSPIKKKIN